MPQAPLPWLLPLLMGACGSLAFDPPAAPAHDRSNDGFLHPDGYKEPYLCWDPDAARFATCPWDRPEDDRLSCDASGCHGDFDFNEGDPTFERHLHGSAGPSCYTCHGQEWSDKKER